MYSECTCARPLYRCDNGYADVGYVFQDLNAFVVNLAPDSRIGDISKRYPIDLSDKVSAGASQDHDLVGSILRDPVKSIDNVSVILRSKSHRSTVTVELDYQNPIGEWAQWLRASV
jgi:hypothetical protein